MNVNDNAEQVDLEMQEIYNTDFNLQLMCILIIISCALITPNFANSPSSSRTIIAMTKLNVMCTCMHAHTNTNSYYGILL